jgi:hypothetical protein
VISIAALPACARHESAPAPPSEKARAKRVEFVPAAPGDDVPALVRIELLRAENDQRDLLVYVGAAWCEPCQRFHRAAQAGQLDPSFPTLRLLEFDADRDGDRLTRAGYTSRLIPLFALPNPDGRASGRYIEGSIKGDGAVGEIAPRLARLVAGQ